MIKRLLLPVLALVVLFEEWLWDVLTILGHRLSDLLHLERFDAWLSQVSPHMALLAFAIPLAVVTPINIGAILLMLNGQVATGVFLEILAKLVGTLLVARVFRLARPALMSFTWFAQIYTWIMRILTWAHALITETPIYRALSAIKKRLGRLLGDIFKAAGT